MRQIYRQPPGLLSSLLEPGSGVVNWYSKLTEAEAEEKNKKMTTPDSLSNTQNSDLCSLSLSRIWLLKRDCTEPLALPAAEEQII